MQVPRKIFLEIEKPPEGGLVFKFPELILDPSSDVVEIPLVVGDVQLLNDFDVVAPIVVFP